jgi:hypothetical protein
MKTMLALNLLRQVPTVISGVQAVVSNAETIRTAARNNGFVGGFQATADALQNARREAEQRAEPVIRQINNVVEELREAQERTEEMQFQMMALLQAKKDILTAQYQTVCDIVIIQEECKTEWEYTKC